MASPNPFRFLSLALKAFATIAILTGAYDLVTGTAFVSMMGGELGAAADDPALNSQLRFLSGIWLGYGVAVWWVAGDLARRGAALTVLALTLLIGGLGRLLSTVLLGPGPALFIFFLVAEIAGPILVVLWHRRILAGS